MARLRAHFDGRVLVPLDRVELPTDRVLDVEVTDAGALKRGSPALVIHAARQPPHVAPEDMDDLERAIEGSKLPVRYDGAFEGDE